MGPRRVGPRRVCPEGWGPEGWGPEGWGPKISRFFSFSRHSFHSFLLLFWSFRGILVVFEAPGRSNVHVWSSRAVVCEPRRPGLVGPPGFHTTAREPKRAHLRVPVFKNTTKIQRKGSTREGEKNKNCGGRGKKRAKFWAVRRRAVRRRAVRRRAVRRRAVRRRAVRRRGVWRRGVRRRGPEHTHHTHTTQQQHSTQQHRNTQHTTHNTHTHTQQTSTNKQLRTLSHTKTNHNNNNT